MGRGAKRALWTVAALVGLWIAVAGTLPGLIDLDRLRPWTESRLSSLLGQRVALGPLRLSLWTGPAARVDGIRIGPPLGSPEGEVEAAELEAKRVVIRPSLLALLRGAIEIRSLSADDARLQVGGKPVLEEASVGCRIRGAIRGPLDLEGSVRGSLVALSGKPAGNVSFSGRLEGDRLDLERVVLEVGLGSAEASGALEAVRSGSPRGSLTARARFGRTLAEGRVDLHWENGRPDFAFEARSALVDLDEIAAYFGKGSEEPRAASSLLFPSAAAAERATIQGSPSFLARVSGRGTIEAAKVRLAGLDLASVRSRVRLGRGRLAFEDLVFDVYGGRSRGRLDVDLLGRAAPFTLRDRAEGIDLGSLLAAAASSPARWLEGTGSLDLDLSGDGLPESGSRVRTGAARVAVRDGRLLSVGLMKRVASALELAGGRGIGKDETPFDDLSASFVIEDGVATTRDLVFRSKDIELNGRGSVGLEGSLRLDAQASFSREASADMARQTPQLRFRVGEDGRLTIPLQVRGTVRRPEVVLDLERVLQDGLERAAKDRGKRSWLKRLLGRGKK